MSAINDLISQIQDESLRDRIQNEVSKMSKQKKFGLVFEEHLPECKTKRCYGTQQLPYGSCAASSFIHCTYGLR